MDQNRLSLGPHHLGVQSGASKMNFGPMVHLAQTMHISCTDSILSPNWKKWDSTSLTTSRSSIGCVQNNFCAFWYVRHKSCNYFFVKISAISNRLNELPHQPRQQEVLSDVYKMISEPMVRVAQTMHLSCTDTNTVSKRTEAIFYKTHIT
jgi:hypothetical protein